MDNTAQKGVPGEIIRHIRRGHLGTRLAPKYRGDMEKIRKTI